MVQPYITGLADKQEEVEGLRSEEDEEGGGDTCHELRTHSPSLYQVGTRTY
jgi:hypothetical protein